VADLLGAINQLRKRIDPLSLQFRLTVGITAVSVLGLGSLAAWTSWQMYQILVNSHKESIVHVAARLPRDVVLYSEMLPLEVGIQKAIDNRTTPKLLIWITRPDGMVLAKSETLNAYPEGITAKVMARSDLLSKPEVRAISDHYLVLCSKPLNVGGRMVGQLYVAEDITKDQTMLIDLVRSLTIVSILVISVITLAIALYVQRSLQPLWTMSQTVKVVSAKDLGQTRLQLTQAPSEVRELAQTFNMMLSRLSEAWEQQQQAWEQQRQFVGNVSHELRTPLTIVHGYLQSTLRRATNLTEPQREALEIAAAEASRTIRLLQDLLDLARAESGTMQFRLESLVLNDLVLEIMGMAQQFSSRTIALEAPSVPIPVRVDGNRLRQVLLNLIDNALKYSDPDQPVTVKLDQIGKDATIQVCDRGYGIPLQHQARVFERFYRVDEARARSTTGSSLGLSGSYGLGLAIVKTLVEGMSGSITVRSKVGEGSIFTITLPAY